ncbi:uncharacterized protein LOC120842212 [Ixodes scapularis]|uniref:uncharacterized protein LOC120842212 n=1 Tax=Ixodes scapularis TaxID=6945 RepID=UPI001A9E5855|nr:uncharacterized protein LOC120842212 [Ixodes scapularis]
MSMYADDLCIWSSGPNRAVICGRLQKALSRIERYLNCRGLHPSPSKCVAMAFTRRSCKLFPIHIGEQIIPYVNKHSFLGIVIDRRLTWAPEMNRLRCKVNSYVNIMRCLSGSTWGNSAALIQLHKSMVLGSLRYSLPLLHRVSSTTQRGLLAQQARSLRVVLGVPRASPSAGVIAEAHEQRIEALRVQETLLHYSRFSTQHEAHHLAGLHISRPASSFAEVVRNHVEAFPANAAPYRHPQQAPWTWLTPTVHLSIPDVGKGTAFGFVKRLLTQYNIEENYKNAIQIYTDGSSTAMSSSSAIYVPDASISEGYKLSHRTSSTASELHGILQALHYIEATSPKSYVVCTDSKSALASLSTTAKKCAYPGLQQAILDKNDTLHKKGYAIRYQWVPGHVGVTGNEIADMTAARAHKNEKTEAIPVAKADVKSFLSGVANQITVKIWEQPEGHPYHLYNLDPKLQRRIPWSTPRNQLSVYFKLRLGVARTGRQRYKYKQRDSPNCATCHTEDTIEHVLVNCKRYEKERVILTKELNLLDDQPMTMRKVLGPCTNTRNQARAFKILMDYLESTGLLQTL